MDSGSEQECESARGSFTNINVDEGALDCVRLTRNSDDLGFKREGQTFALTAAATTPRAAAAAAASRQSRRRTPGLYSPADVRIREDESSQGAEPTVPRLNCDEGAGARAH